MPNNHSLEHEPPFISTTPATADGVTTVYTLNRTLGLGANIETEPVSWITGTPVVTTAPRPERSR
jgi:hypothetical protein